MKSPLLPSVALLLTGVLAGYWLTAHADNASANGADEKSASGIHDTAPSAREAIGQALSVQELADERRQRALSDLFTALRAPETRKNARLLAQALSQLQRDDLPLALKVAMKQRGDEMKHLGQIFARWAELDPAQAAQLAMDLETPVVWQRNMLLFTTGKSWAAQDPAAAQAWAMTLKNPRLRENLIREMAIVQLAHDPAAALETLKATVTKSGNAGQYPSFFEAWARRDPAEATRQACALSSAAGQTEMFQTLAGLWAERDPKAALAWTHGLPASDAKQALLEGLFGRWASADPAAAVEAMRQLPPGPDRDAALALGVGGVAEKNPALARQLAGELPEGPVRTKALLEAARRLMGSSPSAAAELVVQLPPNQQQKDAFDSAIAAWTKQSRDDATAFIERNFPPGEKRQHAIASALSEWSVTEPKAALAWMVQRGYTSSLEMGGAIFSWAGQDAEAALAWIQAQPDLASRVGLQNTVIGTMASRQPELGKERFMQLPESERQSTTAAWIATSWANEDPSAASTWALSLSNEVLRKAAMQSVAETWSGKNYQQSAAWLEKLPPGTSRDAAVSGFTNNALLKDPAAAATWAETISEQNLRLLSLQKVYDAWKESDRRAADQWLLQTPGLTAEIKTSLRQ